MEKYVYCVLENRIVWDIRREAPRYKATNLRKVFTNVEDALACMKDIIDHEEERLRNIGNTRGVERLSDNRVIGGFAYDDVEFSTNIQKEILN